MSAHDCPVCVSYPADTHRDLDWAGDKHTDELSRIRVAEAVGEPITQLHTGGGWSAVWTAALADA